MRYTQLTCEQRNQIYSLKKIGIRQTDIAETIGVHKSTISRELRRNQGQAAGISVVLTATLDPTLDYNSPCIGGGQCGHLEPARSCVSGPRHGDPRSEYRQPNRRHILSHRLDNHLCRYMS